MNLKLNRLANAAKAATKLATTVVSVGLGSVLLSACIHGDDQPEPNTLASDITQQGVTVYPATAPGSGTSATTQDLLTAGLGKTGLGLAAPAYADPSNPSALELRRNAIHSNYRALVDATAAGGYGTLYGPNVDVAGIATAGEGLIAGREYTATITGQTLRLTPADPTERVEIIPEGATEPIVQPADGVIEIDLGEQVDTLARRAPVLQVGAISEPDAENNRELVLGVTSDLRGKLHLGHRVLSRLVVLLDEVFGL